MKLTIEKNNLTALLAKLGGAVEKRNTIPVLAHVALYADGETLTGRTTNLDIEVAASVQATIEKPGSITVPAALLASVAGKMPSGALLTATVKGDKFQLSAGKSKFDMPTLPIEDFPEMASAQYDAEFTVPAFELHRVFDLTVKSMSTEETRYYLNGTYLHRHEGKLRGVSTDGHRLAQIDGPAVPDIPSVIVPAKTVAEVLKLLDAGDAVVSVSDTKIRFEVGSAVIVSRVIDGTFPDYTRVIPNGNSIHVVAAAADIKAAADRVATVADNRSNVVKMHIANDEMRLSVHAANGSTAEDVVEVQYDGAPFEIGFNGKYLADMLMNCKGQEIRFEMGKDQPALVRPMDDDGALYVVMPLRI